METYAGALDLAIETVATAAGKSEWLEGPPLLTGRLYLLPQGWATTAAVRSGGHGVGGVDGAKVEEAVQACWVELRKNSIAIVTVANRTRRMEAAAAAAVAEAALHFDILVPLADVTVLQLQVGRWTAAYHISSTSHPQPWCTSRGLWV